MEDDLGILNVILHRNDKPWKAQRKLFVISAPLYVSTSVCIPRIHLHWPKHIEPDPNVKVSRKRPGDLPYRTFILYCDSPYGLIWKDSSGAVVQLPHVLSSTCMRKRGENMPSVTISCPYPFYWKQLWVRWMKKQTLLQETYIQGLPMPICHLLIMDYVLLEYGILWFSELEPRNERVASLCSMSQFNTAFKPLLHTRALFKGQMESCCEDTLNWGAWRAPIWSKTFMTTKKDTKGHSFYISPKGQYGLVQVCHISPISNTRAHYSDRANWFANNKVMRDNRFRCHF